MSKLINHSTRRTLANRLPSASQVGLTLVELLVLITMLSFLALLYGNSKPIIDGERQAVVSIARTQAIMDALYADNSPSEEGWDLDCGQADLLAGILPGNAVNGFGETYRLIGNQCNENVIRIYQYVPATWASYVANYLESTNVVTNAIDDNNITDYDDMTGAGFEILETTIDQYGNNARYGWVISKTVEYIGQSPNRSSVNATTRVGVQINKPTCDQGFPVVYYQTTGSCSYFPEGGDPYNIEDLIDDGLAEETHFYKTYRYDFQVSEECSSTACSANPWVVSITSWERIMDEQYLGPDQSGDDQYAYNAIGLESTSQEYCSNTGDQKASEPKKIKDLLSNLDENLSQFLNRIGLAHSEDFDIYTINYWPYLGSTLRNMKISKFEKEFSVDLEASLGSNYAPVINVPITVQAWVGCEI